MTEQEFTNRIDGLINDYEGGESTSKELRDGILDTLIELVSKVSPFEARVSPTEPLTDAQQLALNLLKLPLKLDVMSRYIFDANDNMVAEMRGWGWIQYKPQPELMQDTLAQMFTDAFNIVYKR